MPKKDLQTETEDTMEEAMPKKAAAEVEPSNGGLVKVIRDDEILYVHPTTWPIIKSSAGKLFRLNDTDVAATYRRQAFLRV